MYRPSRRGFLASGAAALALTHMPPGRAFAAATDRHRLVPGPATAPLLGAGAPATPVWVDREAVWAIDAWRLAEDGAIDETFGNGMDLIPRSADNDP